MNFFIAKANTREWKINPNQVEINFVWFGAKLIEYGCEKFRIKWCGEMRLTLFNWLWLKLLEISTEIHIWISEFQQVYSNAFPIVSIEQTQPNSVIACAPPVERAFTNLTFNYFQCKVKNGVRLHLRLLYEWLHHSQNVEGNRNNLEFVAKPLSRPLVSTRTLETESG